MKNSWYKKSIVFGIIVLFLSVSAFDIASSMNIRNTNLDNHPPEPPQICVEPNGNVGEEYDCHFNAVDPDGDNVSYYIDWGDGTYEEWTDFYLSGEPATFSHTYYIAGYVTISARAKDIYGAIGNESTCTFHIEKSKSIINPMLLWFLERFPFLERFLTLLIK